MSAFRDRDLEAAVLRLAGELGRAVPGAERSVDGLAAALRWLSGTSPAAESAMHRVATRLVLPSTRARRAVLVARGLREPRPGYLTRTGVPLVDLAVDLSVAVDRIQRSAAVAAASMARALSPMLNLPGGDL